MVVTNIFARPSRHGGCVRFPQRTPDDFADAGSGFLPALRKDEKNVLAGRKTDALSLHKIHRMSRSCYGFTPTGTPPRHHWFTGSEILDLHSKGLERRFD